MKEAMNKRPLALEHLQHITVPGHAALSADGRYLVYTATRADVNNNTYRDTITVTELASGKIIAEWEGASPKWSPAVNEIAYLAAYNGNDYIWTWRLQSGERKPLAVVHESHYFMGHQSVKNFEWSPDGAQIAYVSASALPGQESEAAGARVIDRLLYKTKGGRGRPAVTDNWLSHIWVVQVKEGAPQQVTFGSYNEHSICWSPDGSQIAFISNRSEWPDNNQLHDLWSVSLLTGDITRYTMNFGTACQPAWSPDGAYIAFLGTTDRISTNDSPAEDAQLYIVAVDGTPRCLTRPLDRRVEQVAWHPHKRELCFAAGDRGTTAIYKVAVDTGNISPVTGKNCHILEYRLHGDGNLLTYVSTDTTHPPEVFLFDQAAGAATRLTACNDQLLDKCHLQEADAFWFKSFDGTEIQGWLMRPALFDAARQYPLVLVIHGGPHNMFGYEFEDRMQLLAASGYGVLFINPRGSTGYGQAFTRGTLLNWGGHDYKDLMAGVDAAISRNSWIDPERLGVTGQSYGGYMTNWIITQTNRFRAAVSDGGISNLVSFAGTSLYHSLIEAEFNGSAYGNFPLLWRCSPLSHIRNVTTPTLLLHGETDNEVPLSQAEEMYIALKKLGVDTLFVQYKGEGHGWRPDLKPANRYDLLSRTIGWFDKHLAAIKK